MANRYYPDGVNENDPLAPWNWEYEDEKPKICYECDEEIDLGKEIEIGKNIFCKQCSELHLK